MEGEADISRHERVEHRLHQAFEVGVILKGLNALLETALGLVLFFTPSISTFVLALAERELIEDPNDFLAMHVQALLASSPNAQLFGALYLLSHGVVKLALVWGLLRNKLWAYPASLGVLGLFIVYQIIRFFETHSVTLVLLTVFDIVVVWLIWHEYTQQKPQPPKDGGNV